jgi:hypothetical protein
MSLLKLMAPDGQIERRRATVADIIRPPSTTVADSAHVAAAAYLMKDAAAGRPAASGAAGVPRPARR